MIYGAEMLFQYSLQPQSRRKLDDLLQWSSSEPSRYMSWAKISKANKVGDAPRDGWP